MSDWEIIEGDCIEAMRAMPEASVDSIVTDPPYGLEFMGKQWDRLGGDVVSDPASVGGFQDGAGGNPYSRSRIRFGAGAQAQQFHAAWATEALHVLKPGGHLVAFGGTRTYHRLACALEDAGFEIRDSLMWVYGSGFPKSHNLDGDREGWGTALKPSHEPIVLARKPLVGTVAANVQEHGTGALNVDGCRVGTAGGTAKGAKPTGEQGRTFGSGINGAVPIQSLDAGRWPPNLLLTHAADCTEADCGETCPVAEMDRQSGEAGGGYGVIGGRIQGEIYARPGRKDVGEVCGFGDSGGASRFFPRFRYVAKASSGERNAGLEGMPEQPKRPSGAQFGEMTMWNGENGDEEWKAKNPNRPQANVHPTVKPVALMRWLCRLITPPGGTVLDPFAGSGTTLLAATQEGFRAIGIEREPEYAAIARRRVEEDAPLFNRGTA